VNSKDRLYAWLNAGTFNEKDGCRHPQDIIAAAVGCSERTVIRCVQQLEAEGRLTVDRPRRRGACNTYFVATWNPTKRAGVLNVLEGIRPAVLKRRAQRLDAECHLKRTAELSRAQTTPSPSSPQSQLHRKRLSCARVTGRTARRSYVCDDCKLLAEQNAAQAEELSGALHTVRKLGAENLRLRGAVPHGDPDDPKTANVWFILENWLWLCRGRKRSDGLGRLPVIDPGSKRWRIVQAAERREPEGAVACIEAIEGLACKPYVSSHGRSAEGRPSQRYDDVEYALKDETTVERCRRYRAEVLGASEPVLFHAWQQCAASDHLYFSLWMGKRARDAFDKLPEYKRVAHRMHVAEAADAAETARVIDLHSRRSVA
jgi:hypothetical protein